MPTHPSKEGWVGELPAQPQSLGAHPRSLARDPSPSHKSADGDSSAAPLLPQSGLPLSCMYAQAHAWGGHVRHCKHSTGRLYACLPAWALQGVKLSASRRHPRRRPHAWAEILGRGFALPAPAWGYDRCPPGRAKTGRMGFAEACRTQQPPSSTYMGRVVEGKLTILLHLCQPAVEFP